jgi:hypothetical protein
MEPPYQLSIFPSVDLFAERVGFPVWPDGSNVLVDSVCVWEGLWPLKVLRLVCIFG